MKLYYSDYEVLSVFFGFVYKQTLDLLFIFNQILTDLKTFFNQFAALKKLAVFLTSKLLPNERYAGGY